MWHEFLLVAGIHLLAVMSPGPDFAMVSRSALVHSRRAGIWASGGLALGILVHVSYSLAGIALIISRSILIFNTIKLLGAGYLIYIGVSAFLSKAPDARITEHPVTDITSWQALRLGFLTNVLNPKATLFFLSLFTQVIHPATPLGMKALYGIEMCAATFMWFSLVAVFLSHKRIRHGFAGIQQYFEKVFGVLLVAIGLKIAFSRSHH